MYFIVMRNKHLGSGNKTSIILSISRRKTGTRNLKPSLDLNYYIISDKPFNLSGPEFSNIYK